MTRSPLAYPLNRSSDMDVGGAADLQTDIMRFMAILSLCLVAIFALVQSIPLTPENPVAEQTATTPAPPLPAPEPAVIPVAITEPIAALIAAPAPTPATPVASAPTARVVLEAVELTRPTWESNFVPSVPVPAAAPKETPAEPATSAAPTEPDDKGFTLRFASDAALTRAVAAHHVGLYALVGDQAKRMTVSASRVSFWDASSPSIFHEMEAATVPTGVSDALARTGVAIENVSWGVTLPGQVKTQLDALMRDHASGVLIIGAAGNVHWEEQ